MSIISSIKKYYPLISERRCRDCKHYIPAKSREHEFYGHVWKTDGKCTARFGLEVLGENEACEFYFHFKPPVVCSICGRLIKNFCPEGVYVANFQELKSSRYDGVEFFVSNELGYAILCLECWKKGVKSGELTYGEPPGMENTEEERCR
jgi:hypothetical protein